MYYLYLKSLHIIFIVTWFAGLFYIVRLFVYHTEALDKDEPDKSILASQLAFMAKKLWYIISWPSAVMTLILGISLLISQPVWMQQSFMHIKLGFVTLLFMYHLVCHHIFLQLQSGYAKYTSAQLRIWNELATLMLFAIIFLIVLKNEINWIWGTLGLVTFAVILAIAVRLYKKLRNK